MDGMNHYIYCSSNPIRFVDSNGLWEDEVHDGRENAANTFGTYQWAKAIGFSSEAAGKISEYNIGTDSGSTSFLPVVGNQSYHFNTSGKGESDSREFLAAMHMGIALVSSNVAKEHENRGDDKMAEKAKEKSLQSLGMGLHAKQDIEAHGNFSTPMGHLFYSNADNIDFVWTDDVSRTGVKRAAVAFNKSIGETKTGVNVSCGGKIEEKGNMAITKKS